MKRIGVIAGMLPLVLTAWLSPARADDPPADQAGGQSTTQPDQSQPQDQGDQQKKTEVHSTVTGPEGASATKDVTVTKEGDTVARDATLTGPKGKTITKHDTWTKDGKTVTRQGTPTGPKGGTITRNATTSREGNSVTRQGKVTGPKRQTVTRAATRANAG